MPRSVRSLLVVLAAAAVWLVASPARAAAPLCDDRGASLLAPPPTLDPQNASVDIGMNPDACNDGVERDPSFHEGRAPDPLPTATMSSVLPASGSADVVPADAGARAVHEAALAVRRGVRDRLERPPRG